MDEELQEKKRGIQKQEEKDRAQEFRGKDRRSSVRGSLRRRKERTDRIEKESELKKISNCPLHFSIL
jgi:hypothetical protein